MNENIEKGVVRAGKGLFSSAKSKKPSSRTGGYAGGSRVTLETAGIKQAPPGARPGKIGKSEDREMEKGGPGSGKKGNKTDKPKWNEGGAFLREDTSKDEEKRDVAATVTELAAKYGMSGSDVAFFADLAGSKTYEVNKSEIDNEIDRIAKAMEYTTIEPVNGIKRAIFELGPEGLKKAMENMTGENKELLGDILEEMNKSHKLPLDPPKKLVNVGGENYVEEQVGDDLADEAIFEEAVKEGDNEHKHQGGAHDMEPKDWQGQIIKSILTLDDHEEVLEGLETIYDAWEMKKAKKMEKNMYKGDDDSVAEDVKEVKGPAKLNEVMDDAPEDKKDDILRELRDSKMKKAKEMIKAAMKKECADMKEGEAELMKNKMRKALVEVLSEEYTDEEIEKAMKKGEEEGGPKEIDIKIEAPSEDKKEEAPKVEAAEDVAEEKPAEEAAPDMEKKMKKALELISKSQELLDMGEADLARDVFLKAKDMMKSKGPWKSKTGGSRVSDPGLGGKTITQTGGPETQRKTDREVKEMKRQSKNAPVREIDPKTGSVMAEHASGPAAKRAMKKAFELFEENRIDEAREEFRKAKEMMASDIAEAKQVDQSKSEVGMNMGKGKLKQPEPADEAKTKADDVKAPMAKSIKWYGEENDTFKAGRLGRHNYASSVNSYYDDMIAKSVAAESEVKEELKKSFDANNIEDLIESDLTKSDISIQEDVRMEDFKKSQGSFTKHSFDEADMLKSLGITQEEADKL